MEQELPLTGLRVLETVSSVAGAYAGQLLNAMGAEVVLIEAPGLCPLRQEPPFFGESGQSALFASLSAGKKSVILDLTTPEGRQSLAHLVRGASMLIDDTPVEERAARGLSPSQIAALNPRLAHLSVLPFGSEGPKAGWKGEEINLFHAGGEGFLMPNGLTAERFPDRPPIKVYGHFAQRQGGTAAALSALSALWSGQGQYIDCSVQDANLAIGAFAIQRLGDGSLEHRSTRSFKFGGVIECADGYAELLTLEERQWEGLVKLLGAPDWITDPALSDPVARSARGTELNHHLRVWARTRKLADLVRDAQSHGVPMAPYRRPDQLLEGEQERARGTFLPLDLPGVGTVAMQSAPFRFSSEPLPIRGLPPLPGADQSLVEELRAEAALGRIAV